MMNPLRAVLATVLFLALAGCGGEAPSDEVSDVRTATVKACGYLPTVASVAAMLTASNPAVVGAAAIAQAICNAMSNRTQGFLHSDKPCPEVNGVCIEGEYVEEE